MRSKQNKFMRIITTPLRVLCKARDVYVRSMTGCAGRVHYANTIGYQTSLPKSFSVGSSRSDDNDDLRELIRAASATSLGERIDMDLFLNQQQATQQPRMMARSKGLPKCSSVGMGKIDEDEPCDFGDQADGVRLKADLLYPRSRSYAVSKRSVVY